jgi:hypothetical protein
MVSLILKLNYMTMNKFKLRKNNNTELDVMGSTLYYPSFKVNTNSWDDTVFDENDNIIVSLYLEIQETLENFEKIVVEDGTKQIEEKAFQGLVNVKSVVLPDSLKKIGKVSFDGCKSLKSIIIPDSVKQIGPQAFQGCTSLESVKLPNSLKEIPYACFENCISLKSIVIPEGVTKIEENTFWGCHRLEKVTLPNTITEISTDSAFGMCKELKSIKWKGKVYKTRRAFIDDFTNETITENLYEEADGDKIEDSQELPPEEDIGLSIVSKNDLVGGSSLILTDGDWELWKPNSADGLVELSVATRWLAGGWDKNDYSVNKSSWVYRKWDKTYVILNKNNFEKRYLFIVGYGGMHIPTMTSYSLATWILKNKLNKFAKWFAEQDFPFISRRLKASKAAQKITKRGGEAVYPTDFAKGMNKSGVTSVTFEPTAKRINKWSFNNTSIKEVEIPSHIKEIGSYAFYYSKLEKITLNEGLEKIERGAFSYTHLKNVVIPDSVKVIMRDAFSACKDLKTVFIPSSVNKIEGEIFRRWLSIGEDTLDEVPTVYTDATQKPDGWDKDWDIVYMEGWRGEIKNTIRVRVVWNSGKPNITESLVEEKNDYLSLVKDEKLLYEDSEWKIVKALTFENVVKYAKSTKNAIRWGLSFLDYGFWTGDRDWIELSDKDKLLKLSDVFYNQFEDESQKPRRKKPNFIMIDKLNSNNYLFYDDGGILKNVVGTDLRIKPIYFDEFIKGKNKNLQNWLKGKFPSLEASIGFAKLKEDNINEEVEEGGNYLSLVKGEKVLYEDNEWKILKSVTFDSVIEYAGSDKIGLNWAEKITNISGDDSDDIASIQKKLAEVEEVFYDRTNRKIPYTIIVNKKNKINYLFFMDGNWIHRNTYLLSNKSNNYIDFEKFIKDKKIGFQNWFKKNYSSLAYDIEKMQAKKEYKGIYEYPNDNPLSNHLRQIYKGINIKDGTKQIEEKAFQNFINVKEVIIPDSVITIGSNAFNNMPKLKKVTLSKNLKTIGEYAFSGTKITNINIPDSVEEIGNQCFQSSRIKEVFIPISVKKIGRFLFNRYIKKIYCEAKSKPDGWDKDWDVTYRWFSYNQFSDNPVYKEYENIAEVIWGATRPNITEEVEENNELEMVKDTEVVFDSPEWQVIKILTQDALIEHSDTIILGATVFRDLIEPGYEDTFYDRIKEKPIFMLINKKTGSKYLPATSANTDSNYTVLAETEEESFVDLMFFLKEKGAKEVSEWFKNNLKGLKETMVGYMVF